MPICGECQVCSPPPPSPFCPSLMILHTPLRNLSLSETHAHSSRASALADKMHFLTCIQSRSISTLQLAGSVTATVVVTLTGIKRRACVRVRVCKLYLGQITTCLHACSLPKFYSVCTQYTCLPLLLVYESFSLTYRFKVGVKLQR